MQEIYKLPHDFTKKLKTLRDDYEDKSGIYRYNIDLMFVDQIPKSLKQFPGDNPVLIKGPDNIFIMRGKNEKDEWQFKNISQEHEQLNAFFVSCEITQINNKLSTTIEAKTLSRAIYDIIKSNQAHFIEYKSSNSLSCFFGVKAFKTRSRQISFIEGLLEHFSQQLIEDQACISIEKYENHLRALRALLTLVFFTKKCIGEPYWLRSISNSDLSVLLDLAMQLDDERNPLDNESKALIFYETYTLIQTGKLKYNTTLAKKICLSDWEKFKFFVFEEYNKLLKKPSTSFPVTNILVPTFGVPFELIGYTTGLVIGQGISQSTKLINTKLGLISLLGSGPGFILLAPTIASRFLEDFCNISFSYIAGKSCKILGQGIGLSLGMSVDLSCKLIYASFKLLSKMLKQKSKQSGVSGISLIDGTQFIQGIACNLMQVHDNQCNSNEQQHDKTNNKHAQPVTFEIDEEGIILHVGEEQRRVSWDELDPVLKVFFKDKVLSKNETLEDETFNTPTDNSNINDEADECDEEECSMGDNSYRG